MVVEMAFCGHWFAILVVEETKSLFSVPCHYLHSFLPKAYHHLLLTISVLWLVLVNSRKMMTSVYLQLAESLGEQDCILKLFF